MEIIGNQWQPLQKLGIAIAANRRKRELLADYLQTEGLHTPYAVTDRAGWHHGAYILPNGDIIGSERVFYNGDKSQAEAYHSQGSLEDWRAEIGAYLAGNSRLCLAIGTALAAPLMQLLGMESGGFHLYGDSSDGKTTAAKAALSVWGKPDILKLTWEGTGLGFSNIAGARNDGFLVLDEIGQATPRVVAHTAYSVINGTSKAQGAKEGGNRAMKQWRILVFSTGEKTLRSYTQSQGADWQAGQDTRLPSIAANAGKGYGIYDHLHGFDNGALLSEHLEQAANRYYGSAGRAFIQAIQTDRENAIKRLNSEISAFMAALPQESGQARRVAKRFALIAAALSLAQEYGIIPHNQSSLGVRQCFDEWHSLNGGGKYEDRQIIETAIDWLQTNAYSPRLIEWGHTMTERDHAGYRRYRSPPDFLGRIPKEDDDKPQEFWIIPAVFRAEICKSYEEKKVITVLKDAQWLKTQGKHHTCKRGNNTRYYVLIGMQPPETPSPEPPPADE